MKKKKIDFHSVVRKRINKEESFLSLFLVYNKNKSKIKAKIRKQKEKQGNERESKQKQK